MGEKWRDCLIVDVLSRWGLVDMDALVLSEYHIETVFQPGELAKMVAL